MYRLSTMWLKLRGWKIEGDFPSEKKFIALGAPHTSNFDFVVFLGVLGHFGKRARFIGKHTLFWGPFGWVMRRLGGIPVRRDRPEGLVDAVVEAFESAEDMILVIAPEGTRSKGTMWKSGFYRIASAAGVPIVPASVDGPGRTATVGKPIQVTGDVVADMDRLRAFYQSISGIRPGNETPILLAEEQRGA